MKKRQFIKSGILGLSASTLALSGCNKESKEGVTDNYELKIIPKQTGTYEFSCPMPFNYKTIDEVVELNSTLKKSKITSFYNSIPNPFADKFNRWIHVERGQNPDIKSLDDFFKYVDYAHDKGFEVTYLMNSPKPFSQKDFFTFKNEFLKLLDSLVKHNIKDIKVANTQVVEIINDYAPNKFNLSASCAFEFHNTMQYDYLFNNYSNFNLIDLAYDVNQNFKLLNSLRKIFPNIKIELIVNEPCIKFCPARIAHVSENTFCCFDCMKIVKELGELHYFTKTSYIYPWDLEYYSALGINNFKFTAADHNIQRRNNFKDLTAVKAYLNIVEKGDKDFGLKDFVSATLPMFKTDKNIKLSEIKHLFPDVRYFIAHGHECTTRCGVDCNYCYECAKKLGKALLYS